MKLFEVSMHTDRAEQIIALQEHINQRLGHLLHSGEAPLQIEQPANEIIWGSVNGDITPEQLEDYRGQLRSKLADVLAEFVVDVLEMVMLDRIIARMKPEFTKEERRSIAGYCEKLLIGFSDNSFEQRFHEADRKRRVQKVRSEIWDCFEPQQHLLMLNLDGLISFRLSDYRTELEEIAEYAYEEYVSDKQYQDFIALLKYFVCMQQTKIPIVHLVHKGGQQFLMFNELLKQITTDTSTDKIVAEMLETEMNMEDMVISSLISVCPKQIVIHTERSDMQIIRTIQMIFEDRVSISPLHELSDKHGSLLTQP